MKNHLYKSVLLLARVIGLSAVSGRAASLDSASLESTASADPWSFDVVPYLWLATYSGNFDLPGLPDSLPRNRTTSASAYSTHISAAAMLIAGVGYQFTSWCSASLGYRYMHLDYKNDGFAVNADVQGALLAVGFHC